jgi:signal transduction histidine kinase/CheY-like chemotaxis protein
MPRPSSNAILTVRIAQETDFLLARQRAKQIAALLHFENQDQTRIATAVSEIARNAFEYARGGLVEFFLDPTPEPTFRVRVSDQGPGIPHLDAIWNGTYKSSAGMGLGLIGARRLLHHVDVESSPAGTIVTLTQRLPRVPDGTLPSIGNLATALSRQPVAQSSVLGDQNQELLRLLEELRARESELNTLNEELAETNRGVLVLYAELEDKARAVQQASEAKTRFLSGVTHELRTPLNSIVSLTRLMLSHSDGPLTSEQEKQVTFILRSAQNLTEMVNDLLDLARIEAGRTDIKPSRFTVAELFAGLRGMFRPLATNPGVQLLFNIPDRSIPLHTDEGKLAQILRNLIANALKFTESGTVTVTAHPAGPDNHIAFAVADTGVGIPPEFHDLVMQEWGQVQGLSASSHKGSGLGLPLSRSLAELLGGTLTFTSTPGQGSTFSLTLPALEPSPSQELTQDPPQGFILIAESDEVARYLLRRTLTALSTAPIHEATSSEQVLDALRHAQPEVLFLDLLLPGIPALELVGQLRQAPATAALPIILGASRPLTPEEHAAAEGFDLTVVHRRTDATRSPVVADESAIQIERTLLQVGLSNINQGPAR